MKESGQSNMDLQRYILLPSWLVMSFTSESRKCQLQKLRRTEVTGSLEPKS
jgi:hypothetical protein